MSPLSAISVSAMIALLASPAFAQTATVAGTATYRERIAMTETVVLEVTLEDVSRADAEAVIVSRVRVPNPGQPPFKFELAYEPGRIDARRRYAVRARLTDGDRLLFTTPSPALVITQGHATTAAVVMQMVPSAAAPSPAPAPAAAARGAGRGARGTSAAPAPLPPPVTLTGLPATFSGTLPCADCQGIRYQLNLFPDDSYVLRMTYVGRTPASNVDDIGSWVPSSDRRAIVLRGVRQQTMMFAVRDQQTLRQLDVNGVEIGSSLTSTLRRTPALQPLSLRMMVRGAYRDGAEGKTFTECASGQRWTIASDAPASRDLESAYREAGRRPGDALIVSLEGSVESRPNAAGSLVVERLHNAWPRETCEARFAALPLENTYWRLTQVGGTPVAPAANPRNEAALTFRAEPRTFSGATGCNRLAGKYEAAGDGIALSAAGTLMACPAGPPTDALFTAALREARRYRITGRVLEFFNERQESIARFDGVER